MDGTAPTYDQLGATLSRSTPLDYRRDQYSVLLGHGDETFRRAITGLKTWNAHRQVRLRVLPAPSPLNEGTTTIAAIGLRHLSLAVPCRIIRVIDEPSRCGFAYATLPDHPEQGEECFIITLTDDGDVTFEILAFSRPANAVVRSSGPLARAVQVHATKGYLRSLSRFIGA
jgi:uncharacterized protein (UPF0548 family)